MGRPGRLVLLASIALCLGATPAGAATFTANPNAGDAPDASPGDGKCSVAAAVAAGVCSLRAAVQEANALAGTDTIVVPAGNYGLTRAGADDTAVNGDLDITQSVTIDGAGARSTLVGRQVADGVFDVRPNAGAVTIEGVTLSGGANPSTSPSGPALSNRSTVMLVDSAVRDNPVVRLPGGGIYNAGSLTVDRSLVAGNSTSASSGGGGIYNDGGTLTLRDSTLSGNSAPTGAALAEAGAGPGSTVEFATIASNTPSAPTGVAVSRVIGAGPTRVRDSIVAGSATNCSGPLTTNGHNIDSGSSCGFTDAASGDRQNTDPVLAPLAYSGPGDPTETHVPQPGSPAIDGGSALGCPAVDQRGAGRPSGTTCDSGAVEVAQAGVAPQPPRPAALSLSPASADRRPGEANVVTATARNDNGSPAAGRTLRYTIDGANSGAGIATTDASGVATIAWDGVHEGADTLTAYVDTNGDLTHGSDEPVAQAAVRWVLPAPVQGRSVNLEPVSGVVRVRLPGPRATGSRVTAAGTSNSLLTEARQVPVGTSVDVRHGRVLMTTSAGGNRTQNGQFYGGLYVTRQPRRGAHPMTELRLTESLTCVSPRSGRVGASRARKRRLWGNGKGRFRTRGRHSVATVRGTIWLQQDTCTTTTTVVRRGTVIVKDLARHRNVTVKAGHRYVAHARRR